ncbi:ATP-binding cassette domain-containing protein [Paenibacillus harenae]|uniref:ATPase subunit of ABC transporter with duplicated ATPase domains n=1 Tax=Paenibacillus harenae TaxID=306543 RepID=A0ABT9U4J9_PAEHA|nr:ATPase subunit of ABC transporter with duplicated ATPase domains [Paenibacillus harenae]
MSYAIEVCGLTKSYKDTEVIRGIDLKVKKGELFALLGPNGAGKTTLRLRCMCTGRKIIDEQLRLSYLRFLLKSLVLRDRGLDKFEKSACKKCKCHDIFSS